MTKTLIFFSNTGGEGTTSLAIRTAWLAADHSLDTLLLDACEGHSQGDMRHYVEGSYFTPAWPDNLTAIDDEDVSAPVGLDSATDHTVDLRVVDAGNLSTGENANHQTETLIRALSDGALGVRVAGTSNTSAASFKSFTEKVLDPNDIPTERLATIVNERWASSFTAKEQATFRAAWRGHLDEQAEFVDFDRKFLKWVYRGHKRTKGQSFAVDPVLARVLGHCGVLTDDQIQKITGPQSTIGNGLSRLVRPGSRHAA